MEKKKRVVKPKEPEHPIKLIGKQVKKALPSVFEGIPENQQEAWDWYLRQLESCSKCILHKSRNRVAMPDGKVGAKVLVVGDFPGFSDDLTGKFLTGPSTLRGSVCSNCRRLSYCHQDQIVPDLKKYFKKKLTYVECEPSLAKESQVPPEFYMRTPGALLDGILDSIARGKYPRQSWIDLKFPEHPEPSIWAFIGAVSCRAYDPQTGTDAFLTKDINTSASICKDWLHLAWAILKPDVIIALGPNALQALVGEAHTKRCLPGEVINVKTWGKIYYVESLLSVMWERYKPVQSIKLAKIRNAFASALEDVGAEHI